MAGNAISNLINNRKAIRRLMAMDSNGEMNKIVENAVSSGALSYGENGATYNPQAQVLTENNINKVISNNSKVVVNEEVMKKSKLPQSVLESFKQDPGTPFSLKAPAVPASVLDGLDLQTLEELREETQKPMVTEQIQPVGGSIDYSLLRTIINEAVQENVKKYVSAMTKKLMNESVKNEGTVQAVKIGDKFSFITENGDVYEATLKFKTNLNEQTKNKKKTVEIKKPNH